MMEIGVSNRAALEGTRELGICYVALAFKEPRSPAS